MAGSGSYPNISPLTSCVPATRGGYGPCKGDSGGPMVKFVAEKGHYELIGNIL